MGWDVSKRDRVFVHGKVCYSIGLNVRNHDGLLVYGMGC